MTPRPRRALRRALSVAVPAVPESPEALPAASDAVGAFSTAGGAA